MNITIEQVEKLVKLSGVSFEEAKQALEAADGDILEAIIALEQEGKTAKQTGAYNTNDVPPPGSASTAGFGNPSGFGGQGNAGFNAQDQRGSAPNSGFGPQGNFGNATSGAHQGYYGAGYGTNAGGYQNGAGCGANAGAYQGGAGQNDYAYKQETSGFGDALKKIWQLLMKAVHTGNVNHFEVYKQGASVLSSPVTVLVIVLVFFFWITLPVLIIALFFGCRYRFRGPDLGRDSINKAMDAAANTAEDLKQSVKDSANPEDKQPE
jgi:hypothetical protein